MRSSSRSEIPKRRLKLWLGPPALHKGKHENARVDEAQNDEPYSVHH